MMTIGIGWDEEGREYSSHLPLKFPEGRRDAIPVFQAVEVQSLPNFCTADSVSTIQF